MMNLNPFRRKANNRKNGLHTLLSMGNGLVENSVPKGVAKKQSNFSNGSTKSLSTIALKASLNSPAIPSHQHLNRRYQMQVAEAIYDESKELCTASRLEKSFKDTLRDQESLSYFVQFMESLGSVSRHLIRLWVQLDCFQRFSRECEASEEHFKLDAEGIWEKFLAQGGAEMLGVDESLVRNIEHSLAASSIKIDPDVFSPLIEWIENNLENHYFMDYLRSYYHCKYQVTLLTSGNLRLADILYHDRTLFYFMEFMEHESMNHYVDFLVMAENCRKADCTKEDLLILFQRFFDPNSPNYLDMGDFIKCQIEEGIGVVDKHCFDRAMSILIQYLEETYFQQFLSSQTFFSFLDESIKALQISSDASSSNRLRHDSGGSDRSTVVSTASSAFSSNHNREPKNILSYDDYDAIWKRQYSSDIQMATVDQYGKVFSHFLPDPNESHSSFSLSKAVKIFRNNAIEEKEKEELAYKVAQRIVDDVKSITQASCS